MNDMTQWFSIKRENLLVLKKCHTHYNSKTYRNHSLLDFLGRKNLNINTWHFNHRAISSSQNSIAPYGSLFMLFA